MPYATVFATPEGHFLSCERDGAVLIADTCKEAAQGQEDVYNEFHNRGYEASMSACMFHIQFRPMIVELPSDTAELLHNLEGKVYRLSSIAGNGYGWKIKPECIETMLNNSVTPRLISEETFNGAGDRT